MQSQGPKLLVCFGFNTFYHSRTQETYSKLMSLSFKSFGLAVEADVVLDGGFKGFVFAYFGYVLSDRYRRDYGETRGV